jgi:hypothetical protein
MPKEDGRELMCMSMPALLRNSGSTFFKFTFEEPVSFLGCLVIP